MLRKLRNRIREYKGDTVALVNSNSLGPQEMIELFRVPFMKRTWYEKKI